MVPESVSKIKLMLSEEKNEGHLILSSVFPSPKYSLYYPFPGTINEFLQVQDIQYEFKNNTAQSFLKSILKFAVLFPFKNMDNCEIVFANQILNHPFFS